MTDGVTGGGTQDFATYGTTVSDQMVGYLNLEVKTGNMKLIKTSEDGKVEGISFTITGEGYNATKTTNAAGEIDITDLNPGVYTVTEQSIDKYEPQATQRVTIVSGQTATVTFNNVLKRGSLEVTKTSEDGLAEGMTFHLSGTSLSGLPVDEYAVTDSTGVARFENVLIGTGYVLEEVDTPIRYVVPEAQTATIEWNEVTDKTVNNILKSSVSPSPRAMWKQERPRATAPLPERPTGCIRAIPSSTALRPTRMVSSPPAIMSATPTGRSVKSIPARATLWIPPSTMWARSRSYTPLS